MSAISYRVLGSLALVFVVLISVDGLAQNVKEQRLELAAATTPVLIENHIGGDSIIDYVVAGERSQILSVDMLTSNASAYFNILLTGSGTGLFTGSIGGNVADVHLPETGDYTIRVYLIRSAARRNETADYSLAISIGAPDFADGLAGGPDFWAVSGVGDETALNLRSGPAARYAVIGKLRNGDVLQNQGCRISGDRRWCSVRSVGSGMTGWVAGRYLVESAPSPRPRMPAGGPDGNGTPFDAIGSVPCAMQASQPMGSCLFGVIRQGSGNAGVWMAIGGGIERYVLFESGEPVTSNTDAEISFDRVGDLYRIRIAEERFEIPEAVVNGD